MKKLMILLLLVCGCARTECVWRHPSKDIQQFQADKAAARLEAIKYGSLPGSPSAFMGAGMVEPSTEFWLRFLGGDKALKEEIIFRGEMQKRGWSMSMEPKNSVH